jgi:hypothetical protein
MNHTLTDRTGKKEIEWKLWNKKSVSVFNWHFSHESLMISVQTSFNHFFLFTHKRQGLDPSWIPIDWWIWDVLIVNFDWSLIMRCFRSGFRLAVGHFETKQRTREIRRPMRNWRRLPSNHATFPRTSCIQVARPENCNGAKNPSFERT